MDLLFLTEREVEALKNDSFTGNRTVGDLISISETQINGVNERCLMDVIFSCTKCMQELIVDASGAGSEIECPSCHTSMVVPEADAANVHTQNPISTSAAAKEERHYSVPHSDKPVKPLIKGALKPLEVTKDGDRQIRVKTIRRTDCVEVGSDHFDARVSEFLQKVGEKNVMSVSTVNYSHEDMATKKLVADYGVLIVYKG